MTNKTAPTGDPLVLGIDLARPGSDRTIAGPPFGLEPANPRPVVVDAPAYPRALQAITADAWAIIPEKLDAISGIVERRLLAGLPVDEAWANVAAETPAPYLVSASGERYEAAYGSSETHPGSVAVLPIRGTLMQRASGLAAMSGAMSTERISAELDKAVRDPNIGSILLDIDSPGGSVYGIEELGAEIFEARKSKRIVALANSMAASAAYWLGSQAHEFVITPGGDAGSIGVVAMHVDYSGMNKARGVRPTFIHAGRYKVEGNPEEPLGDEARARIQARVDAHYDRFVRAVARGRGVAQKDVREGFGQGRVLNADESVRERLADRIAPRSEVLSGLRSRGRRQRPG